MKLSVLIQEGPYNHEASDSAYNFIQAALAKGHTIRGIFFYDDGVYNATKLMDPPQDDRHISKRWSELGATGIDMIVCVAAAKRRGITNEVLAPNIRISGLGQLAGMISEADRLVTFGDWHKAGLMAASGKKVMVTVRKAPHGSIYVQESIEVMFIFATYDMDLSVVFLDDGVLALHPAQDTKGLGIKGFMPSLGVLVDWEVTKVYVDRQSLKDRNIPEEAIIAIGKDEESDAPVRPQVLDSAEIAAMMAAQHSIVSF